MQHDAEKKGLLEGECDERQLCYFPTPYNRVYEMEVRGPECTRVSCDREFLEGSNPLSSHSPEKVRIDHQRQLYSEKQTLNNKEK